MKPAGTEFIDVVNRTMTAHGIGWNDAWSRARMTHRALHDRMIAEGQPTNQRRLCASQAAVNEGAGRRAAASKKFTELVRDHMKRTGTDWNAAWASCSQKHADVVNEMNLPQQVELSSDGQRLTDAWPVPPAVLMKLGLPFNVTREQFQIWKAADRAVITPEVAARFIVELTRHGQLSSGQGFDEILAYLEKNASDLFKSAMKAAR